MIDTCANFGVISVRDDINPGVWVEKNKIGAVGIRVSNKVTKHGLAFNVTNSLDTFSYIIPCGLKGRGVTNLLNFIKEPTHNDNQNEFYARSYANHINVFASVLGKKIVNLSDLSSINKWKDYLNVDEEKYEKYIETYIKTKGSSEKLLWNIVIEYIEKDLLF